MQISVFYDHITQARQQTGGSLSQLLEMCRSWGIEGLEINYTQLQKGGLQLRQEFRKAGLSVSCIYEFYDFTHSGDIKQAKKQVDLAVKVGAGKVLIVPGFLEEQEAGELEECCCGREQDGSRPGLKPERSYASRYETVARYMGSHASTCRVRDALRELVEYGEKKGVKITLEDFDGYTSPCARMLPLKWLMEQVPGLGFTLDMGNFAYSGEDVTVAYDLLQDYIVHVHCKDRGIEDKGLACVPVGCGYLPVRELAAKLKAQGYDGYLAIEHFDAPDQVEYMRRSAEYLKSIG
ncbi:MAG: sugar phosphate isomerase/epimerase [Acetatifactor sp.]|nr:sugar phosphate isomerase/epimerase [Acetatifactor sp.]